MSTFDKLRYSPKSRHECGRITCIGEVQVVSALKVAAHQKPGLWYNEDNRRYHHDLTAKIREQVCIGARSKRCIPGKVPMR